MHVGKIQLILLLMGKATSATWTLDLNSILGTIAETPALTGGDTPESAWVKAAGGYLIQPVELNTPDIEKGRQSCRELDKEATLFHTGIDPLGTDLLLDNFIEWDVGVSMKFMIDHTLARNLRQLRGTLTDTQGPP